MAGKGFNDLELLSQEDLIVGGLRQFLDSYAELSRRQGVTGDWLKSLCSFSLESRIWFILWEGGRAQRFTDILKVVGCSTSTLNIVLMKLLSTEPALVRIVEGRYQAVSPAWLVRKIEADRQKI